MSEIAGLTRAEMESLLREYAHMPDPELAGWPYSAAREVRRAHYGDRVFFRGLIEFTSYCSQDCLYCGLRRSNKKADRYRLTAEQILDCCNVGHNLGYRTFVLQGGEDGTFTDHALCDLVETIKARFPDCAVTLSLGERSAESYRALRAAGADRYLLRHETADAAHFARLHPREQTLESRKRCLYTLRELGFQTGAGLMVGSPGQTPATLAADLDFLRELQPQMVGIGPFIPHEDTPFAREPAGTLEETLLLLALTRLLLPQALLPATTALGTIHPQGREKGLRSGANVVMPNLSPVDVRERYALYNGKICTGEEAAECRCCIEGRIRRAGFIPDFSRGDHAGMPPADISERKKKAATVH